MIAELIVNNSSKKTGDVYDYLIPPELDIKIGMRVKVNFAAFKKPLDAFVLNIKDDSKFKDKLKPILCIVEETEILSGDLIELIKWLKEYYLCTYYEALKAVVPSFLIKLKKSKVKEEAKTESEEFKILTEEQSYVKSKFLSSENNVYLLRGVTGSGKTEVFMSIIKTMTERGLKSIVLVPEISLTSQMVERFKTRFKDRVAVFHSMLTDRQRYNYWHKIKNGEVDIVVGARSAIFAPFSNLGVIILDEEHENSYKAENSPKYHTREVALKRAAIHNCKVLLASATPSVESYYKSKTGRYVLLEMTKRYNSAALPEITVCDMRKELASGNKSIFSDELKSEINKNLLKKEQTILFLNRRGFTTFVNCRSCGYVVMCSECNISLTYHITDNTLRCHYCGLKLANILVCPKCQSKYIRHFGIGTQKIEEEVKEYFKTATTIRMDTDTVRAQSPEFILKEFSEKKIDILIGTQMIAKGLDYKNITLVGIIAADASLNIDDFRAGERTFQLITQVAGRAGRGDILGRAVIQTYDPENFIINIAKNQDYLTFYEYEIRNRKNLLYPPFTALDMIMIFGRPESEVAAAAFEIGERFSGMNDVTVLGPNRAPVSKIKNEYRWRIIIKHQFKPQVKKMLADVLEEGRLKSTNITISVSRNPNSMY